MNAQASLSAYDETIADTSSFYFPQNKKRTDINIGDVTPTNIYPYIEKNAYNNIIETLPRPLVPKKIVQTTSLSPLTNKQFAPAELLAEWSGCVTDIQESSHFFSATLKGIEGDGVKGEEDDAIIPISDVSEGDKDLLQPGNFFRLCVMHEVTPSGQPRRYSLVIFRRMPAYRKQDLDASMERGRKLARGLRVE